MSAGRDPAGQALAVPATPANAVDGPSGFDPSRSAVISDCGRYRYRLERQTPGLGRTAVIMVNPSTADASQDDATIRKLCGFGLRHRWGRIVVGNLFAYRATDVRELAMVADPVGPENDEYLFDMLCGANQIIFAWGPITKQPKLLRGRWKAVAEMVDELGQRAYCIGQPAKCGHPRHPLMLAYAEPILRWGLSDICIDLLTNDPAIATEARRAETENTGSVHEGAGRNAALPENKSVNPYALGGGK